jgi:hypothetical protein
MRAMHTHVVPRGDLPPLMCDSFTLVIVRSALPVALAALFVAPAGAAAHSPTRHGASCRVPRLTGLTLTAAQKRAAHAGCTLRVKGAPLEEAAIQTVERQAPHARARTVDVTAWINPLCRREAAYAPELEEPLVTLGPTELVSGFYLVGGPDDRRFSTRGCRLPEPPPGGGTVEVLDASGAVVATQTSEDGQFVEIPLPPGSYTIDGTFLDATSNGVHPKETESVVIAPGHTVRQDFLLNIR